MERPGFKAVIFDLDGVVTRTASVHAEAWKIVFDEHLKLRSTKTGEPFQEFTIEGDYLGYVDGKPRQKGIQSFLASRNIQLPLGPDDSTDLETVNGIGNKKNGLFREVLEKKGVEVFQTSVDLIKALKAAGIRVGLATSSKNGDFILKNAGLTDLFESKVDGIISAQLGLKGKPEGDIFIRSVEDLGILPAEAVVVEDATSGVAAGRNGGFGLVLGVAREKNELDLLANGADVVVCDLGDISMDWIREWFERKARPLFECWDSVANYPDPLFASEKTTEKIIPSPSFQEPVFWFLLSKKKRIMFLDYDGTLTPIVSRPDLAIMDEDMREVLTQLSKTQMVAIVSGRMREDVENLVKIPGLFYAGSHGFDIKGPDYEMILPKAKETIPVVAEITEFLKKEIGGIPGALVEEKKFSVAAHYRLVEKSRWSEIEGAVKRAIEGRDSVRLMGGKMVYEILPNIEWNKGKAIRWIMEALHIPWNKSSVVYVGDDVTDENAFRAIRTRGAGILVCGEARPTTADFQVKTPDDTKKIFEKILSQA